MGEVAFETPEDMVEILSMLNSTGQWNLSVDMNGNVSGFAHSEWGITKTPIKELIEITVGDQLVFSTKSLDEAKSFLYGCFLSSFHGKSLATINSELRKSNF